MFKKYAPKFILVDAIRVTEENLEEIAELCKGSVRGTRLPPKDRIIEFHNKLHDSTLHVNVGEWLMKGKDEGDFYPCKDEVFSQKYIEHSALPFETKDGLKWEGEGYEKFE